VRSHTVDENPVHRPALDGTAIADLIAAASGTGLSRADSKRWNHPEHTKTWLLSAVTE